MFPGKRRYGRYISGNRIVWRSGLPYRVLGRWNRPSVFLRPEDRTGDWRAGWTEYLSDQFICHHPGTYKYGYRADRCRSRYTGEFPERDWQALWGEAFVWTCNLRPGDDSRVGTLLGYRKLFPLFWRPDGRWTSLLPARLFPERFYVGSRWKPCHDPTDTGHVRGRLFP